MATDTATRTITKTLSTTVVDTISLTGNWPSIEVWNMTAAGGAPMYLTVAEQNQNAVAATPVADAKEVFTIPAGSSLVIDSALGASVPWTVKILGNGNKYQIVGMPHGGNHRNPFLTA